MNWERAKNLCILFLVVLNLFLVIMINIFGNRYKLDERDKKAILSLLEKYNIKFDLELKNFEPKYDLNLVDYRFFDRDIRKIFVDLDYDVKIDVWAKNGFDGNFFVDRELICDDKKIRELCNNIVGKVNFLLESNFVLDSDFNEKDGLLVYIEKYNGFDVIDNFIEFKIKNYEIEIKCRYRKINGFIGERCEICSPDLVLYEFIKSDEILKIELKEINKFNLVYKIKKARLEEKDYICEPVYELVYNDGFKKYIDAYLRK